MVRPITKTCKNEHVWTKESTYTYYKNGKEKRGCRICRADAERTRRSQQPVSQRTKSITVDPTKLPRYYVSTQPDPEPEPEPMAAFWPMFQLYPDQMKGDKRRIWKNMELMVARRMGHTPAVLLVHETLSPSESELPLLGDSLVIRTADRKRREPIAHDRSVFFGR